MSLTAGHLPRDRGLRAAVPIPLFSKVTMHLTALFCYIAGIIPSTGNYAFARIDSDALFHD
jgi:hypothetical protein